MQNFKRFLQACIPAHVPFGQNGQHQARNNSEARNWRKTAVQGVC